MSDCEQEAKHIGDKYVLDASDGASCAFKVCSKCKVRKPSHEFTPRSNRPLPLYSSCKLCKTADSKARRRQRKEGSPVELWVMSARANACDRAKTKGVLCTLTQDDVRQALAETGGRCIYCGIMFNFQRTTSSRRDSPSVDRIVPSEGYTRSNIAICCYRCNAIKSDATYHELYKMATVLKGLVDRQGDTVIWRLR